MNYKPILALLTWSLGSLCLAQPAFARSPAEDHWPIGEQETIDKTLMLSGQPMRLVVDDLDGYVHVRGGSGSQVHVVAHKIIRAETQSDLAQAKSEVRLEMTEQPGSVSIEYDAPWRCRNGCDGCCKEHRRFYEVTYDIDVEVPRQARTDVSTVNGDLRLNEVDGDFDVHGVNGAITMDSIGGSGGVHTVNGPVSIHFSKNPLRPCSFKSVNGALDAYFQPGLSADLFFKTFNGQVYSDFEVTPLPVPAGEAERKNGMFVYRSNRQSGARAGRGGPQLTFETLNGSIRLY